MNQINFFKSNNPCLEMIKRGFPDNPPRNYPNNPDHFPAKNPPKKTPTSSNLSTSTKALLVIVVILIFAAAIFIVIKSINNDKPGNNPVDKFTADLKISDVEIMNYTDISIKMNPPATKDNVDSIIFIFYDVNNSEI